MRAAPISVLSLALIFGACTEDAPLRLDAASPPEVPGPDGQVMTPGDDASIAAPDAGEPADAHPNADAASGAADATVSMDATPSVDAATPPSDCPSTCVAWNRVSRCTLVAGQPTFAESTCPNDEGCYGGACTPRACSDECDLGQSNCRVWDMGPQSWGTSDAARRPEDRARHFEKWLRSDTASMFHEGIVSVRYTDASCSTVDSIYLGDTALHTGIYLAAEAARLQITQSARARNTVLDLVGAIDLWFHVSGDPAVLATIAVPAGDRRIRQWTQWDCADYDRHCDVAYAGQRYDFVGDPSRDMYVGPLLGLVLAYDGLTEHDAAARERIREMLMVQAEELIRLRTLSVVFEINGAELPPRNLQARFFIPDQREMVNGRVFVSIDTGDLDNSGTITGGQEFMPNPSQFFRQVSLLSRLPDIPRSSSAMMVAAMLRAAIHVSDGVPAYASRRQALIDFYLNNADGWGNYRDFIAQASRSGSNRQCGDRYFGFNISFIPSYVWAKYEDDPMIRARVVNEVVGHQWSEVATHKNPFFGVMTAEVTPGIDPAVPRMVSEQVTDFPPPPRYERPVDLRNDPQYRSRESGCTDQLDHTEAVDTGDRVAYYFAWHSHPWALRDAGSSRQTYPGHDYLVAYWLARLQGALSADRPATCLRVER